MTANPTAFRDAERTNNSDRNAQIFKDINLSLARHPITGDIATLSNVEAVKRSVRNLVNTNFYERPFHPEIGSNVRSVLFEPVSPIVATVLERHVRDVIANFEPRAELVDVIVSDNSDANEYRVQIKFFIVNSSDIADMNIFLERLR
jgi:phage baseplate assembly protein W|tara:strand:- start:586 stop:1026 length:441 start_codon:yes stop_codon:yes gene_type:complete